MKEKYRKYYSNNFIHYPVCPIPGWELLIDTIIEKVIKFNQTRKEENQTVKIFQIKQKFSRLVVYLETAKTTNKTPTIERFNSELWEEPIKELDQEIQKIASKGYITCKICGKEKVQTVDNSRIKFKCLNHWNDRRS
tara:strand:- start:1781 stop:2191 length:411 start_codon:yes stop_codon:yes gene_type:complete